MSSSLMKKLNNNKINHFTFIVRMLNLRKKMMSHLQEKVGSHRTIRKKI